MLCNTACGVKLFNFFIYDALPVQKRVRTKLGNTRQSQHLQECKDPRQRCFLWFLTFDLLTTKRRLRYNTRLIMEYFYVKLGDSSCISVFEAKRQTNSRESHTTVLARVTGKLCLFSIWRHVQLKMVDRTNCRRSPHSM